MIRRHVHPGPPWLDTIIFLAAIVGMLWLAGQLRAEEPKPAPTPPPSIAQLQAKITSLEAQLAKANADLDASRQTIVAEHAACWTDDLGILNTRYAAAIAQKKAAALQTKPQTAKEEAK